MKSDHPSYRDRLIARVRPEFRSEADRFLRGYSNNPNEPIFWFFVMLADESASTRAEIEEQKRRISVLTGPDYWHRILFSWVLVPILLAAFVLGGIAYLNHQNMTAIRKLTEHPAEIAAYSGNTLKALQLANDNAANINAAADLLNVPELGAEWKDGKLVVVVPQNSVLVTDFNERFKRITFIGDLRKIFGNSQRIHDNREKEKPASP